MKVAKPLPVAIDVAVFVLSVTVVTLAAVFNLHPAIMTFAFFVMIVALAYLIYLGSLAVKKIRVRFYAFAEDKPFINRMARDYGFRTMVFSSGTFLLNAAYTLFNLAYGMIFRQMWNVALGIFYLVLSITRFFVVTRTFKARTGDMGETERKISKLKIYRATGVMLMLLSAALNLVVLLMLRFNYAFRYYGLLIVVAAVFAVCKMILAIYNVVKVIGIHDYAAGAARNINFASALVSLLALQTALLASFPLDGADNWIWNAVVGTVICVVITGIGVDMVLRATRKLKRLRAEKRERESGSESESAPLAQ